MELPNVIHVAVISDPVEHTDERPVHFLIAPDGVEVGLRVAAVCTINDVDKLWREEPSGHWQGSDKKKDVTCQGCLEWLHA